MICLALILFLIFMLIINQYQMINEQHKMILNLNKRLNDLEGDGK